MKPKWHRSKLNLEGNYQLSIVNSLGGQMAPGVICDAYNLGTINGAIKSGVGLLLAKGESGKVNVYKPGGARIVQVTVEIGGEEVP